MRKGSRVRRSFRFELLSRLKSDPRPKGKRHSFRSLRCSFSQQTFGYKYPTSSYVHACVGSCQICTESDSMTFSSIQRSKGMRFSLVLPKQRIEKRCFASVSIRGSNSGRWNSSSRDEKARPKERRERRTGLSFVFRILLLRRLLSFRDVSERTKDRSRSTFPFRSVIPTLARKACSDLFERRKRFQ